MPDTTQLEGLIARLANDRALLQRGEAATRQGAVNPTLRALGWNTDDLDEVDPEFADSGGGKVDYCLRYHGKDLVLIEVKRAGADLAQHQEQLLRYAFGLGVELAALTNGVEWWLYLPMKGGRSFEGRRFARIDFRGQDAGEAAVNLNRFLNRDACVSGHTLTAAEAEFERQERDEQVRAVLPKAWSRVLGDARLQDLLASQAEQMGGVRPDPSTINEFLQSITDGGVRPTPSTPTQAGELDPTVAPGTPPPQQEVAGALEPESFKGRRLAAFWLDGARYDASVWRRMLQMVCERVASEAGPAFAQHVAHLRGRTRVYFSGSPDDLYRPMEIGSAGLYAEGNLSADDCVRLVRRVLEAVRGSDAGFRVEVNDPDGPIPQPAQAMPSGSPRPPPVDLVVALLAETGAPLHYREIERRLRESGKFEAGGRDPANTLLGRFFNDSRLTRTGRGTYDLLSRRDSAPDPPHQNTVAQPLAPRAPGDLSRFAGRRIAAFWLDGHRHEVASWPLMVRRLSEHLISNTGPMFAARVEAVRGTTRKYFSHEPEDLTRPRALKDSRLYVEGNLGPDSAVRVARLTLQAVRGSDDGFRIELAE